MERNKRHIISETAQCSQGFLSAKHFVLQLIRKARGTWQVLHVLQVSCYCYFRGCSESCGTQHEIPALLEFDACSGCLVDPLIWTDSCLAFSVGLPWGGSVTPSVSTPDVRQSSRLLYSRRRGAASPEGDSSPTADIYLPIGWTAIHIFVHISLPVWWLATVEAPVSSSRVAAAVQA